MALTAHTLEILFYSTLAFFVLAECLLTALHSHKADAKAGEIPEDFTGRTSEAAQRRAANYTGEVAQAELLLVFAGALFAWLMTYGQGLTVLAAASTAILGPGQAAQWLTLALLLLLALIVEFPLGWYMRQRVKKSYGVKRSVAKRALLRGIRETVVGYLAALPLIALSLTVFDFAGDFWWLLLWVAWLLYLFWRRQLGIVYGLFRHRRIRAVRDESFRAMVRDFLASEGFTMTDLVVTNRPHLWKHSHVVLAGWGKRRRVVIFSHAMQVLTPTEILALIAHDVGHIRHRHTLLRTTILALWGLALALFAGWGSTHGVFFEGFGVSRHVTFHTGAANAGWVLAVAIATFPIIFYPFTPLRNLLARTLQYDADLYGARLVGAGPMIRALVKLHRDYSSSLWPSHLYSLFHYSRPHVTMRVARLRKYLKDSGQDPEQPVVYSNFDRRKYAAASIGEQHRGEISPQSPSTR